MIKTGLGALLVITVASYLIGGCEAAPTPAFGACERAFQVLAAGSSYRDFWIGQTIVGCGSLEDWRALEARYHGIGDDPVATLKQRCASDPDVASSAVCVEALSPNST